MYITSTIDDPLKQITLYDATEGMVMTTNHMSVYFENPPTSYPTTHQQAYSRKEMNLR